MKKKYRESGEERAEDEDGMKRETHSHWMADERLTGVVPVIRQQIDQQQDADASEQ